VLRSLKLETGVPLDGGPTALIPPYIRGLTPADQCSLIINEPCAYLTASSS